MRNQPVIIKLRPRIEGKHIKETVFIGQGCQLQNAGEIVFSSIGEWQLFGCALLLGAAQMQDHLIVTNEGGPESAFMRQLEKQEAAHG